MTDPLLGYIDDAAMTTEGTGALMRHRMPCETTIRAISFVAIAILCAQCRANSQPDPVQIVPLTTPAEISAREDCLHREVARLLEPEGSPPTTLQKIAVEATNFCSQAVRKRLLKASPSVIDGQNLVRDDQLKAEHHAFAIGLKLRERAGR
jgi:hypothetical protein